MGMTAGVIGVTAGVAGASTPTDTVTGTAPTVTATQAGYTAAGVKITLGTAAIVSTHAFTVPVAAASSGTVDWTSATVVLHSGASGATVVGLSHGGTGTSTLTFTVPATVTASFAHYVLIKPDTLTNHAASGAISASPTGTTFTGGAAVTIADAVTSTHGTIKASSAPSVAKTGTGQKAGTLTITLPATATTRDLTLTTSSAGGPTTVVWQSELLSSSGGHTGTPVQATTTLTIPVTAHTTAETITVSNILYTTTGALGTVTVTPAMPGGIPTFVPTFVVNATAPAAPAGTPFVHTLSATSKPPLGKGTSGAAGNWTATESANSAGTATAAKSEGWTKTQTVTITVAPNSGLNCAGTSYVLVTGTPKATVGTTKTVSTTPTVSVSTAAAGPCTVNDHNVVSVTFTNSGSFTGVTGTFSIMASGVKYEIGKTTPTGNVSVSAARTTNGTAFTTTGATNGATAGPSNAKVTLLYVTANTPAVNVPKTSLDATISPVNLVETAPGQVSAGYVCIALTQSPTPTHVNMFNTAAKASAKVANSGDGTVTSKVTYESTTGGAATSAASAKYALFKVTLSSTKTATTYEVSGLGINASTLAGTVTAKVYPATGTNCDVTVALYGTANAYTVQNVSTQIYGATADATAVKELETQFPTTTNTANTAPTRFACPGFTDLAKPTAVRPVILATTKTYQDALSSSYLAGYLHTGTLLTPTTMLSTVTKRALRTEGVTQVYVVGGPLAVTATVVKQVEALPAYSCGGVSVLKTGKTTVTIQVTRIYGQTQYGTAERIAETPPASYVNEMTFTGAYAGVNATKGDDMYNTTAGTASASPLTSAAVPTAILASGVEFQDAMAASAVAYGTSLPVLLTAPTALSSQAAAAIATLGIKQVILMGGQLAVTNTVVKQLQAMGVSVLRIGGKNYTGTAVQLAMFEQNTATVSGLGWPTGTGTMTSAYVARGNGFTDALAGAVLTGNAHLPQLLTLNPTTVGATLTAFLKAAGQSGKGVNTTATAKISSLTILGGPLAVSPSTIAKMETDIS